MTITGRLVKRLGARYVPPNAVHFSDLSPEVQNAMLQRAPILKERHFDWLFTRLDRVETTWWVPFPPRAIRKSDGCEEVIWVHESGETSLYCKPIPAPGQWFENAGRTDDIVGYRASTDEQGNINRYGARFDDIDNYITWPTFRAGSLTDFFRELAR